MALDTGMKMIKTEKVTVENAAKTLGSGSLLVYGTPAMLLFCLLYTSPSPRDGLLSRMPSSA